MIQNHKKECIKILYNIIKRHIIKINNKTYDNFLFIKIKEFINYTKLILENLDKICF